MDTGQVVIVVNGIVALNTIISSNDFRDNIPVIFEKNILLGAHKAKYK